MLKITIMVRTAPALLFALLTLPLSALELTGRDILIPVVGRGPGAFGSMWQTDVIVTNLTRSYPTLEIELEYNDEHGAVKIDLVVPGGASIALEDFVATKLGRETALGTLRVRTAQTDARIAARAWVYNTDAEQEGKFGQNVQGLPVEVLPDTAEVTGLATGGGRRSNVGVANPGGEPANVRLTISADGGLVVTKNIRVPAHGVVQINDVVASLRHGPGHGSARIRADMPVYAYASVIDAGGDPIFIIGAEAAAEPVVQPACANPLPLGGPSDEAYIAPGYYVLFLNGTDAAALTAEMEARYHFEATIILTHASGFHALLTPEMVAGLRCEPVVQRVARNTVSLPLP